MEALIEKERKSIQSIMQTYAGYQRSSENEKVQCIFDEQRDHYQLMLVGWENKTRIYGCLMHMDIQDGKVRIQYNGTEVDLAQELVDLGIPKDQIVIGFHSPFSRQFTEYAVS